MPARRFYPKVRLATGEIVQLDPEMSRLLYEIGKIEYPKVRRVHVRFAKPPTLGSVTRLWARQTALAESD